MEQEVTFDSLLDRYSVVVERYINFRLLSRFEADDVIQETYYAAYLGYDKLKNKGLFKPWILSIAKNQCNIWLRKKYHSDVISIEEIADIIEEIPDLNTREMEDDEVLEIIKLLPKESAELLTLTMKGYKQSEIAEKLSIPLGTVKSRLHYAKKQFRSMCTSEQITIFEKGRKNMTKKDFTCGFPATMPTIVIKESASPFVEIKCADEAFIIPEIGNKNSEATYRYKDKRLALVSTCYVPKAAVIHGVVGVQVCRDTYNVRAGKLYKNEKIWFSQLTDDYIRDLGTINGACEEDNDIPTTLSTFLEENYDVICNGNDRVHGRPLLIKENPLKIVDDKMYVDGYNIRYTMGMFDLTIGERIFDTVKYINLQNDTTVSECYVDTNGRLIYMRWYESVDYIKDVEWYGEELKQSAMNNPMLIVNDAEYRLVEERISEYAL